MVAVPAFRYRFRRCDGVSGVAPAPHSVFMGHENNEKISDPKTIWLRRERQKQRTRMETISAAVSASASLKKADSFLVELSGNFSQVGSLSEDVPFQQNPNPCHTETRRCRSRTVGARPGSALPPPIRGRASTAVWTCRNCAVSWSWRARMPSADGWSLHCHWIVLRART